MSYNRGLSPSGRRTADPRYLDAAADAYHSHRHNSAILPRTSHERVIPISTQTYVDTVPSGSSRASRSDASGYDSYTGRPRRSSLVDGSRGAIPASARSRPAVLHDDATRTMSPARNDREYYVVPASSKDSRGAKKVYSMEGGGGGARLISETDILPDGTVSAQHSYHKHHRRTDSEDKAYRNLDRTSKSYAPSSRRDKSIDDDDAFSYTDPAGMYRETQPSWRERDFRPRRGSLDRTGGSRERSMSNADVQGIGSRRSREIGPPPSQRGWDKINEGIGRTKSLRDGPREVDRSPHRGRNDDGYSNPRDPYYIAPRRESKDRTRTSYHERRADQLDPYDAEPKRDPVEREHRLSVHKPKDRSVSRRGFGIRSDSQERKVQRRSDDSLNSTGREEPGYESRRRDIASDTEYTGRHHRKYRDNEERRDRGYDDTDTEGRSQRHRDRADDKDRHRREDSRDHAADTSLGSGAKIAGGLAAGTTAAAAYGLLHPRDNNSTHERKRSTDEARIRRDDDSGRRRSAQPEDTSRRDDGSDRRRSTLIDDTARRNDRPGDSDRGLGFAFEGPPASSDKARLDVGKQDVSRDPSRDTQRKLERSHEDTPPALQDEGYVDPDEEYRRRIQQAQRDLGHLPSQAAEDADRERRRRERENRMQHRREHLSSNGDVVAGASSSDRSPRSSFDTTAPESSVGGTSVASRPDMIRRPSIMDEPMPAETSVQILDNSLSDKRENRVRIVDPPTEEEERRPKGILKRPTQKFPEDLNAMREGVAPLKDSTKKGIPPGARWTKIDRRLVNPEALEEAKERYEERLDCVIVLRVLTKEEIQKLADRTKDIRDKRFAAEERAEKRASRRHDRDRDRRDRDEYSDDGLEDWERDEQRPVRMLEAAPAPASDHNDRRSEQRDR